MLSIITPYKNAASYLNPCIQSVLNQSFTNWQWILVNDGSTDDSLQIVTEAAKKDQRLLLLENTGTGILPALQMALNYAKGTFITRMDADDIMPTSRLKLMVKALEAASPKTVVTGTVAYISEQPISEGYLQYEAWLNKRVEKSDHWKHIYRECVIASPNWMMRTDELLAINGFDSLLYPEDYDLCFRWYAQKFTIKALTQTTLHWREHPSRTSRNSEHYQQPAFFELKLKRFLELDYKANKPLIVMGEGVKAKLTATFLEKQHVPFLQMANKKQPEHLSNMLYPENLKRYKNAQILIAVYPDKEKRQAMEKWLSKFDFELGKNYWYL